MYTIIKRNVQKETKYPYCIHTERGRGARERGERDEEREEERIGERVSREGKREEREEQRDREIETKTLARRDHICYS